MEDLENNLSLIHSEIKAMDCPNGKPKIVAVSKKQSIQKIRALYALGIRNFAENFAQEAVEKIVQLELDAVWHFIGNIQSNKTKLIANHFDWAHSITRLRIAERLNNQRTCVDPLNVCIQVKIDDDDERESVNTSEVRILLDDMKNLEKIRVRGLMGISTPNSNPEKKREDFIKLFELYKALKIEGSEIDTLSMGMSDDYKIAIQNGSNMIRIGTLLFGKRDF